jgi:carbamoyl-phosphate synthase large subunit
VLKALRENSEREVRVIGADANPSAAGLFLADRGEVIPMRSDPDGLTERITKLCAEADVFLPLSTEDQEFYRSRAQAFGIPVVTSSLLALRTANDKLALLEACSRARIPCPRFARLASLADLPTAAASLGYPDKPFVLKTNRGQGASGVKVVDPSLNPMDRFFDRNNLRVRYEDVEAGLVHASPLPDMHLAEYLPGREYSVDLLCDSGVALAAVVRHRLATLYGLATHAKVVDDPATEATARRVVELLGLSYVVNVQLRADSDGVSRLMEVNPRIPGTIGLTVAAGINMPYLALKIALGEDPGDIPQPETGTELIRYWGTIIRRAQ